MGTGDISLSRSVNSAENHWFDCLVDSAVAASMQGAAFFDTKGFAANKTGLSEHQADAADHENFKSM